MHYYEIGRNSEAKATVIERNTSVGHYSLFNVGNPIVFPVHSQVVRTVKHNGLQDKLLCFYENGSCLSC